MILVTGGTGLVGSHLLLYLSRKGHHIRALYRQKNNIEKTRNLFEQYSGETNQLFNQIEWVFADITDISTLEPVFMNITQVYHVAAQVSFNPKDKASLMLINHSGTANMVNLALEHKIDKFLYVSSIATLGLYDNPITEQTHWNWKEPHSDYAISKFLGEMEVWRAGQEGLPAVIVNPSVILGAHFWEKGTGQVIEKLGKGLKFYPTGSNGFVDVWDVVKAMADLMQSSIANESYIVSAYDITYKEFFETMARTLHKKPPQYAMSKIWANLLWLGSKFQSFWSSKNQGLSKNLIDTLFQEHHYTSDKLVSALDFHFIPFQAAINNIVLQYKKTHPDV